MSAINVKKYNSASPGTGITLWSYTDKSLIGTTFLGEKNISSEELGEKATNELLSDFDVGSTLDVYAIDQLLPYMVLAKKKGSSNCIVRNISNHTQTNMWLLKQFFNVDFEISQLEDNLLITVR
jgi:RNA 3'-terminal phosphate cyclase (ATP)